MSYATSRFCRRAAAAAAILLASGMAGTDLLHLAAAPRGAAQTPSLIQVSTEPELQDAAASLTSGGTIVLSPGTYRLTTTLNIKGGLTNVTITGSTSNPTDVTLVGMGMTNPDYADVPHGISVGGGVQGITIANLTIRDVYGHAISLEPGTEAPRLYNLRLVDAGRQFVKAYPDGQGGGVDDGVLENSVIEYTVESPGADTGAVHVAGGARWAVRSNRFRNIRSNPDGLAAPAVLMTGGARDSLIERNTFINCQQEIALGADDRTPDDHAGGLVRNNFIVRDFTTNGAVAIQLTDSPGTKVLHNTILSNRASASLIEYRLADTTSVVIRNNLLDGSITAGDGATGTASDNYLTAVSGMFADPSNGDLHLLATALEVIDRATPTADAATDFDGDVRPRGSGPDYGADEAAGEPAQTDTTNSTVSTIATATMSAATTTESSSSSVLGLTDPAALPEPWRWTDVGSPQTAGSATWSGEAFTVRAAGSDIGGNTDQFTFVYQTLDGDGEIIVRVADLDRTHPWAKAGLMFRDELLGNAKFAGAFVTAEKGLQFQFRIAAGSNATQVAGASERAPQWLKLSREGQTFTAFGSTDGATWSKIGSEVVYLNKMAYVGLAVTSRSWRVLTTATFAGAVITPIVPDANQLPTVTLTSPTDGSGCHTPCSIDLTAAASDPDGSVTSVAFYAGSSLIGSVDRPPYTLVWKDAPPGIHRLKAAVRDNDGATATSPVVEVDVSDNQAPAVSLTMPASGSSYTAPATIALGASATDADGGIARVDFFAGPTLVGSDTTSPYTASWANVAAGSYTLTAVARDSAGASTTSAPVAVTVSAPANVPPVVTLSAPAEGSSFTVGSTIALEAQATDADGAVTKVEFYAGGLLVGADTSSPYRVTWSGAAAGTYTLSAKAWDNAGVSSLSFGVNITVVPATTLPSPWQTADVGNPAVAGSADYSSGSFMLSGAGTDIGSTSDQFRFVYQQLDGDGAVVACVTSLAFVDEWTKAGVMIRGALDGNAPYAFALVSAGWGTAFHHRAGAGESAAQDEPAPAVAPHCVRLVRRGSAFTAYQSADGTAWVSMGTATIAMGVPSYVGLAVTSRQPATAADAVFENVAISAAPSNEPPTVTLTSPAAGASVTAPATVTLSASASDADGSVVRVDFYANATLVGSDGSHPYSATWSDVAAGSYTLTAVAHDDSGASRTSTPVEITVTAPNQPPVVAITIPSNNATFTAPIDLSVSATASDADGSVSRVDFYAGTTLIGSDSSGPFSATWTAAPPGTHSLSAVARDNSGAATTSAPVTVTISSNQAPSVSLTAPANGATFAAPANITVSASASDSDGTIAVVEFYAGTTRIGSDTSSPYSVAWGNVPAGSYTLKAVAKDNAGATKTSAGVSITVAEAVEPPRYLIFNASTDHSSSVTSYTVEFFAAGKDPATATPVKVLNIGKPTPVNGEITVDIAATVDALPSGSYFSTVMANNSSGSSRSAPSETFVR